MKIEKMLKNEAEDLREFILKIDSFNFKEKFEKYLVEASESAEGIEKEFVSAVVCNLTGDIADLLSENLLKLDKDKLKRVLSEFYYDGYWGLNERNDFDDIFSTLYHITDEDFYNHMKPKMIETLNDIVIAKDKNSIAAKIAENERKLKDWESSLEASKRHISHYEERIKEVQENLNKLKGAK